MLLAVFGDSKRLGVCFEFHRNDEIPIVPEVTKTSLQQMLRTVDGLRFEQKTTALWMSPWSTQSDTDINQITPQGLEPQLTVPETVVLPLHHGVVSSGRFCGPEGRNCINGPKPCKVPLLSLENGIAAARLQVFPFSMKTHDRFTGSQKFASRPVLHGPAGFAGASRITNGIPVGGATELRYRCVG